MKVFIATIGWTEWPAASAIIAHGLSRGDRIILLTPAKRDERSKAAVEEISNFVSKFVPSVEVSEIQIPIHNPVEAISIIAKLIKKETKRGGKIIVNLSGGMRALVIETMLALTLIQTNNIAVELRTEDKVDIQIPRVWGSLAGLSLKEEQALKVVGERAAPSLGDLAGELKVSIATAHRLLRRLEGLGAMASRKVGRERRIELTQVGRILLAAMAGDDA